MSPRHTGLPVTFPFDQCPSAPSPKLCFGWRGGRVMAGELRSRKSLSKVDVMRLRTRLGTSALSYEKLGLAFALGPCSQHSSEKQKSIVGKGWVGLELLLAWLRLCWLGAFVLAHNGIPNKTSRWAVALDTWENKAWGSGENTYIKRKAGQRLSK